MGSVADDKLAAMRMATGLATEGFGRVERKYWLDKLALPESSLLSLSDAKNQFLTGNNSVSDDYYVWLATQPGGNIPGSVADRESAVFRTAGTDLLAFMKNVTPAPSDLFPLDDPSGTVARNYINGANTATIAGTPIRVVAGPKGTLAMRLNGPAQTDYITALPTGAVTPTSFGMWFKPVNVINNAVYRGCLFGQSPNGRALFLGPCTGALTNEVISLSTAGGNSFRAMTGSGTVAAGVWHFIGCSWTGTQWEISLDGVQIDNATAGTPTGWVGATNTIGRLAAADSFDGDVANFAYWLSAVPMSTFASIYSAGV